MSAEPSVHRAIAPAGRLSALVLSISVLAATCLTSCAPSSPQPCSAVNVASCHPHIDMQVNITGSLSIRGDVQRDESQGQLCSSTADEGALWNLPMPATPTAVDGHLLFGEGSIIADANTGPGTYPVSAVMGFEVVVDDLQPFVPGTGTVSYDIHGSGSLDLVAFSNGSADINVVATWTCSDENV